MPANFTNIISYDALKEEIVVFLRNNLTDPNARGTAGSDVWTAGGASGNFTLSQLGVKNISSVTVGGVAQAVYVDYTPDYKNTATASYPTIILTQTPASGTSVQVNYRYGETWIYPDWPRTDLGLNSYPRICADVMDKRTKGFGIGGNATISDLLISVSIFADKQSAINTLMTQIGSCIIANSKNFYNFQYIVPSSLSPLMNEPGRNEKIVFQTADFLIPERVEK
jgi:hypothetical protein